VLAGLAVAAVLPSRLLALLLGPLVLLIGVVLLDYSLGYYESCEAGQPCATAERVLEVIIPVAFLGGSAMYVAALARYLRFWSRSRRTLRRRQT
jgi:hypothetical protein